MEKFFNGTIFFLFGVKEKVYITSLVNILVHTDPDIYIHKMQSKLGNLITYIFLTNQLLLIQI